MMQQSLPVIRFSSHIPGILNLNGSAACEIRPDMPCAIPVSAQGALYIGYSPLLSNTESLMRRLDFHDGHLMDEAYQGQWEGLHIVCWPNKIYDITLDVQAYGISKYAYPHIHTVLEGASWTATIVEDGDWTLIIEKQQGENLLMECSLGTCTHAQLHECGGILAVEVRREHYDELFLAGITDNGWKIVAQYPVKEVHFLQDRVHSISRTLDIPGHHVERTAICQHGQIQQWSIRAGFDADCQRTMQSTAAAMIEAIRLHCMEDALALLTPSLREGLNWDQLVMFIGQIDHWMVAPSWFGSGRICIGVLHGSPTCRHARCLGFELIEDLSHPGHYLIDNITEE